MQIPFVSGSYLTRSLNNAASRCINLYPEITASGDAKTVTALIGCPGTRLLATLGGSGGIRAAYKPSKGDAIVVRGDGIYRVDDSFVPRLIGTILTTQGLVSIAENGTVAVIVDGLYGYIVNLATSSVNRIIDPAFYGSDLVDYLDGFFIFNKPGTQQFYISGLLSTTFDALDFASAEGSPDNLVSFIVDHREAWFFGEESAEVFYNSGSADFPLSRQNIIIEQGCAAKFSVAKLDNSIVWLGKSKIGQGSVWRVQGYSPVRISTHAVEFAIQGYDVISDAIAYTYEQEGHIFYVLTFPSANATWVYDASTQLWHERAYRKADGSLNRHRSNCHCFFGGEHVVGDWENGNLYALDLDYYSDNGDAMPAIRSAGHVSSPGHEFIYWDSFQVDCETGVGLQSGQGSDPKILLDFSDDGGHTWSNEKTSTLGAVGKYRARALWRRLGRSRDRVNRITITDPVKRVILSASASVRKGGS